MKDLSIAYQDQDVVVVNKPAGILVYPDKYTRNGTLRDQLLANFPEIKSVGEAGRDGIVHRLDKDTSGLLVVARHQKAYAFLVEQFKNREVQKKYYALVYGKVKKLQGAITFDLAKKGRKTKEKALTYYRVEKYFGAKNSEILRSAQNDTVDEFTLLDVEIKTGIMHQIRQHLKMLGHPIVGDKEYTFKNLTPPFPINRQFLHAYYLKLRLLNGKTQEVKSDLSKELDTYLKNFEF